MDYCFGCMKRLEGTKTICECGFSLKDYRVLEGYLQPGTVLKNRYLVGKILGKGGFGVTYLGLDQSLEMPVAIKELSPRDYSTRVVLNATEKIDADYDQTCYADSDDEKGFSEDKRRFLEEAKKLALFNQVPGIVEVRDSFEDENAQCAYIVMDYIEGKDLQEYLLENTLSEDEIVDLMKPVFEAIKSMHKEGMLHRDISPDNIRINKKGEAVLIDFGTVREITNDSMTGFIKGEFTPPEVKLGLGQPGIYSDVYSLAATLYYSLTKERPTLGKTKTGRGVEHHISEYPINISQNQADAIMRALSFEEDDRFQSVEEFEQVLYSEDVKSRKRKEKRSNLSKVSNTNKTKKKYKDMKMGERIKYRVKNALMLMLCCLLFVGASGVFKALKGKFSEKDSNELVEINSSKEAENTDETIEVDNATMLEETKTEDLQLCDAQFSEWDGCTLGTFSNTLGDEYTGAVELFTTSKSSPSYAKIYLGQKYERFRVGVSCGDRTYKGTTFIVDFYTNDNKNNPLETVKVKRASVLSEVDIDVTGADFLTIILRPDNSSNSAAILSNGVFYNGDVTKKESEGELISQGTVMLGELDAPNMINAEFSRTKVNNIGLEKDNVLVLGDGLRQECEATFYANKNYKKFVGVISCGGEYNGLDSSGKRIESDFYIYSDAKPKDPRFYTMVSGIMNPDIVNVDVSDTEMLSFEFHPNGPGTTEVYISEGKFFCDEKEAEEYANALKQEYDNYDYSGQLNQKWSASNYCMSCPEKIITCSGDTLFNQVCLRPDWKDKPAKVAYYCGKQCETFTAEISTILQHETDNPLATLYVYKVVEGEFLDDEVVEYEIDSNTSKMEISVDIKESDYLWLALRPNKDSSWPSDCGVVLNNAKIE